MNEDLRDLLSLLKSNSVEFLVVGAHALAVYSRPRFTEDVDLWIRRSEENAAALRRALLQFGFQISEQQSQQMAGGRHVLRLGHPPNQVDILNFLGSQEAELDFDNALANATVHSLSGVDAHFLSKKDLIAAKKAAGRPQDLADVAALEAAPDA